MSRRATRAAVLGESLDGGAQLRARDLYRMLKAMPKAERRRALVIVDVDDYELRLPVRTVSLVQPPPFVSPGRPDCPEPAGTRIPNEVAASCLVLSARVRP